MNPDALKLEEAAINKKVVLKSFAKLTGKHLCRSLFFINVAGLRPAIFFQKKTTTQFFSCQSYEIFEHIFITEHFRAIAFE